LVVERNVADGLFGVHALAPELALELHRRIAGDLCPEWAGRWRDAEVRVGEHHPPPPYRVPMLMRDYGEDLGARLENATGRIDDLLLETLGFAEGRLLSVHPFTDLNGRVTRLFLRELLRRLGLPPVGLVPTGSDDEAEYRAALRAGDGLDWKPLAKIWQKRFEQFNEVAE
jgi:CRISPR-associated endonuclease/helicase Cas3